MVLREYELKTDNKHAQWQGIKVGKKKMQPQR